MRRGETINEGQRLPTANLFFLACRLSCPSSDRQVLGLSPVVYSESASQFTAVRGERAATMLFGNGSGQGRSVLATVAEQRRAKRLTARGTPLSESGAGPVCLCSHAVRFFASRRRVPKFHWVLA